MRSLPWRRHAHRTTPARLTATVLLGSAATVAALVATDVLPVPSWALDGIDVASHQHPGGAAIDWDAVAASGQSFAFIKATEGTGYGNPYFSADSAKAAAAGITEISQKDTSVMIFMAVLDFAAVSACCAAPEFKGRIFFAAGKQPQLTVKLAKGEDALKIAQKLVGNYAIARSSSTESGNP